MVITGRITTVWNPIIGCKHNCVYCWARALKGDGFTSVKIHELNPVFKCGDVVLVETMGDLFGAWVPGHVLGKVRDVVLSNDCVEFVFLTKNPERMLEFAESVVAAKDRLWFGVTIETDIDGLASFYSDAPPVSERFSYANVLSKRGFNLFVSVEPVMAHSSSFPYRLANVKPKFVILGKNRNPRVRLPEPSDKRLDVFVYTLRRMGVEVVLNGVKVSVV